MNHKMDSIIEFINSRPIFTGVFGTVAGWTGALTSWMNMAHTALVVLGALFGTVAAFYTMLIVIRNYHKKKES